MMTFYFAYAIDLFAKFQPMYAGLLCSLYPNYIGIQKKLLFKIIKPFKMEEVYEFGSLAFAAMPYRFIYLTLDTWT